MSSLWLAPVLFGTGFVAGFVDSIAGGGGLITVPALLSLGLSPTDALGTNKLQSTFGSASATWHYARAGVMDLRACRLGLIFTCVGALLGALAVQLISKKFLELAIPVLLIVIAAYTILRPQFGEQDARPRMKPNSFALLFGLTLGFYDGFFGPGTGSFWAMACVLVLGQNLLAATGYTKAMNFASNLASLAVFIVGGKVHYGAGLVMGIGQLMGARLGSKTVLKRGVKFIRPVFIGIMLVLTAKLIYQNYFSR
ncbi:MAG: TSUP family transporter [Verrucomicrobia bacterium]|nr:TSUP family transporter [Verrucomicrobiota bacterium]